MCECERIGGDVNFSVSQGEGNTSSLGSYPLVIVIKSLKYSIC